VPDELAERVDAATWPLALSEEEALTRPLAVNTAREPAATGSTKAS
jgi:hypothetical protein